MKMNTSIQTALLLCLSTLHVSAFYDDTVETHLNVKDVKTDFGAVGDGITDDSAAFQAAIDWISTNGGGDLVVPYDADGYLIRAIRLKSDVHLLIDADTTLYLLGNPGGNVFVAGETGIPAENISIRGVGGSFIIDLPYAGEGSGTRAVNFSNTFNFMISDIDIMSAKENYSGLVFGVSGFDQSLDSYPTQGTIKNASIYNAHFGYGLVQVQAADTVLFENLYAEGGVALRLETGWDKMNIHQFGGAHNIVGRDIMAVDGHGGVLMGAHAMHNGLVQIERVHVINCGSALSCGGGFVNDKVAEGNPNATNGTWAEGSYVRDVIAEFGYTAQLKQQSLDDVHPDLQQYIQEGADGDGISLGPSLKVASNAVPDRVTYSDVKSIGFDYAAPVTTDGDRKFGFCEEGFDNTTLKENYHKDLDSAVWAVDANKSSNGFNWFKSQKVKSYGIIDTKLAVGGNHAVHKLSGFELIDGDSFLVIGSDFRYKHDGGGAITQNLDIPAFGLLICDSIEGGNCAVQTLTNRGTGLGFSFPLEGNVSHSTLGVNVDNGGLSDWFRLEWVINRGSVNYEGTPYLYDDNGVLLLTGSTVDLGIANGTKIYSGYTTGPESDDSTIYSFSAMNTVRVDNFHVEKSGNIFRPVADASVSQLEPDTNFGSESSLFVTNDTNDVATQQAYLRFDLSSVVGSQVRKATLRIRIQSGENDNKDDHTVNYVSDDSWGEDTLTWNTKPAVGAALTTATVRKVNKWMEIDVTDQVRTEVNGDDVLSVVLTSDGPTVNGYYSKETGDKPELVVELGSPIN